MAFRLHRNAQGESPPYLLVKRCLDRLFFGI